jgi:RHS repeat-associated protein
LKLTDATGDITHEYRYDAYGRIETGSTQGGYSFTGREWDPETSLFYYRARYYDPHVGRFLSDDPIGLGSGWNLYVYAESSPTNFVDPDGLASMIVPPGFEMSPLDKLLLPLDLLTPLGGVAKYGGRKAAEKTIRNTAKQIRAHEKKLLDYLENPYKYDNKDFLKNAPDPSKVIEERIDSLIHQIKTFCKNIEEAWKKL